MARNSTELEETLALRGSGIEFDNDEIEAGWEAPPTLEADQDTKSA